MTECRKPEVEIKKLIFSISMPHTVPTYQIWRFHVEPIARY